MPEAVNPAVVANMNSNRDFMGQTPDDVSGIAELMPGFRGNSVPV